MAAATLKLIIAFLYACRRWMSVERREKRRGNIGKLSTMVDSCHVEVEGGSIMTAQLAKELWIPLYERKIRGPRNIFITSSRMYGNSHLRHWAIFT